MGDLEPLRAGNVNLRFTIRCNQSHRESTYQNKLPVRMDQV